MALQPGRRRELTESLISLTGPGDQSRRGDRRLASVAVGVPRSRRTAEPPQRSSLMEFRLRPAEWPPRAARELSQRVELRPRAAAARGARTASCGSVRVKLAAAIERLPVLTVDKIAM